MKTTELALVAAAALVLMFIVRKSTASAPASSNSNNTKEIDIPNANGWRYFTDGTAIGPDGKYYYRDTLVYNPAGMMSL